MAVTVGVLSDTRRRTLEEVCDTFAPSLARGRRRAAARAFYARVGVRSRRRGADRGAARADGAARGDRGVRPAARRDRGPGLRCGATSSSAPRSCTRSPTLARGQARRAPGARDDVPVLLRPARRDGPERQLGGDRLPGPALGAALARAGAEDDPARDASAARRRRSRPTCAWSAREPAAA